VQKRLAPAGKGTNNSVNRLYLPKTMKNSNSLSTLAMTLTLGAIVFAGCKTPEAVKSTESAVTSMADIQNTLTAGSEQIASVMTALNDLGESVARDGKKSFKQFSSEVDGLEKLSEKARGQAEKMRAAAEQHYAQWQAEIAQISNSALKDQSQARRDALMKEFEGLKESMDGLKNAFNPFMSDLTDLRTFLAADLSASGYSAAESVISELKSEAVYVQRQLGSVVQKIKAIRGSMAVVPATE